MSTLLYFIWSVLLLPVMNEQSNTALRGNETYKKNLQKLKEK